MEHLNFENLRLIYLSVFCYLKPFVLNLGSRNGHTKNKKKYKNSKKFVILSCYVIFMLTKCTQNMLTLLKLFLTLLYHNFLCEFLLIIGKITF